jgi:alpha-glucosidase
MQWDGTAFAGFSTTKPWLPVADNFPDENVDRLRDDKGSLYWLYRRLVNLRRSRAALAEGNFRAVAADGDLLLFFRELPGDRLLIALNLGSEPIAVTFASERLVGPVLLSSFADREGEEVRGTIDLRGNEGLILSATA